MKILGIIVAFMITAATIMQLYRLQGERTKQMRELNEITQQLGFVSAENKQLEEEIQYYKNPANLEREARTQFNYVSPGEKLIIVVPPKTQLQH